jgi:aromatic-L-amino-acid decarboxylase
VVSAEQREDRAEFRPRLRTLASWLMSLPPPNGIAPFAEGIAAALNQNCNFWRLSRSASVIERKGIGWLSGLLIDPETSGGVLLSGGSMATQYPRFSASRSRGRARAARPVHFGRSASLDRQECRPPRRRSGERPQGSRRSRFPHARICGPLLFARDRGSGPPPFCVVAGRGTTGAIDPIAELTRFRAQENLGLPVDGAYGALLVPSDRCQDEWLPGGQADSIALDPHKMLLARWEAGGLLVKDLHKLRRAFHFASSYRTVPEDPLLINFLEYGPELSRSFKAFQIGCSIQALGLHAFPHGD